MLLCVAALRRLPRLISVLYRRVHVHVHFAAVPTYMNFVNMIGHVAWLRQHLPCRHILSSSYQADDSRRLRYTYEAYENIHKTNSGQSCERVPAPLMGIDPRSAAGKQAAIARALAVLSVSWLTLAGTD